VAVAVGRGIGAEAIAAGIHGFQGVPGRFQLVPNDRDLLLVIDYAHTPDALERVLRSLDELPRRRLIAVFGCGGDRDRTKRPRMGRIAAEIADLCIVTSDNPRTEDPQAIIDEIVAGIPGPLRERCLVIPDRREAIRRAIAEARPFDVVVVAGKGHEDYQIVGTVKHHFSDEEEVRAALGEDAG